MMEVVDWPGVSGTIDDVDRPTRVTSRGADDGRLGVVAALHEHVGLAARESSSSGVSSLEDDDGVHHLERGEHVARAPPRCARAASGPLSRRTEASLLSPTTSASPCARARRASTSMCPGCSRSKTPLVKTTRPFDAGSPGNGLLEGQDLRAGSKRSPSQLAGEVGAKWNVRTKSGNSTTSSYSAEM